MDKADDKPHIFDIYTKNPQTCQLAVMLTKQGELVGRALVWKIDEIARWESHALMKQEYREKVDSFYKNFDTDWQKTEVDDSDNALIKGKLKDIYLMDRVYYTKDWIETAFKKWA